MKKSTSILIVSDEKTKSKIVEIIDNIGIVYNYQGILSEDLLINRELNNQYDVIIIKDKSKKIILEILNLFSIQKKTCEIVIIADSVSDFMELARFYKDLRIIFVNQIIL